ncbi:MAG: carbohydrate kinase family protein [Bacteroidales bacterium]|nr:carbohydrate kinase family protein [Bacteroidales bacterium]
MQRVFVIGGTTFDHIIYLPEFPQPVPQTIHDAKFNEATGSTGAGKALCLQKLEVPNTLYSVLGDDSFGQQIIKHLKKEQVDFIYDIDEKGTERHFNIMDEQGNRISVFVTQSSEKPSINISLIEENIRESDIIVLNIISYCKQIVPVLKHYDKPVWTDLHDYNNGNPYHEPFIDASDYIFLSSDNLTDYKKTMQSLMERGKELVVCSHGKNGATALTSQGEWIEEPALSFEMVDANGAGDSFFSGFLWAFMKGKTVRECMKYGTICGGLCITSGQLVYDGLTPEFLERAYLKYY